MAIPITGLFEAKKHAFRQTQEGVVISFVMHPSDVTPELAAAPLGTILEIAYREPPTEAEESPAREEEPAKPAREKRAWRDIPKSQQAGIACADGYFRIWLAERYAHVFLDNHQDGDNTIDTAAKVVRLVCEVKSRTEFDTDPKAGARWTALHTKFLQETKG